MGVVWCLKFQPPIPEISALIYRYYNHKNVGKCDQIQCKHTNTVRYKMSYQAHYLNIW